MRQQIPKSHSARIRAWLKYGLTPRQAAEIYGVAVSDIEHILQKA